MSKKIIIATLMRPDGETGVQTHFNQFHEYLSMNDFDSKIVTPFSYFNFLVYPVFAIRKVIHPYNKPLSVWWYRFWHAFFLEKALKTELSSTEEAIVYAQCPLSANAALKSRKHKKQKVFLVIHFNISQAYEWCDKGFIEQSGSLFNSIKEIEKKALLSVDGIVYVSAFMKKEIEREVPEATKINNSIIPNFIKEPIIVKTKINADLITIGSLEKRKNQKYAIEIIHAMKELGHTVSLTIVGDGPDMNILKAYAEQLNVIHLINFIGFKKNADQYLSNHKAYLHTANIENLPISIIEALSRALPIFATNVGGIPEMINDNKEGLLLTLGEPVKSAEKILMVLNDQLKLNDMSKLARLKFEKNYENNSVSRKLVKFIQG